MVETNYVRCTILQQSSATPPAGLWGKPPSPTGYTYWDKCLSRLFGIFKCEHENFQLPNTSFLCPQWKWFITGINHFFFNHSCSNEKDYFFHFYFTSFQRCVVVQEVYHEGLISSDGRLQPGDQVIEINGIDMTCAPHAQVRLHSNPQINWWGYYLEVLTAENSLLYPSVSDVSLYGTLC